MLDFRMETFLAVCQYMNFTRASEKLKITQPAVSQHIHFLEKYYKTKLFRYEGRRLTLTAAGEILKNASLSMMHDEDSLKNRLLNPEENRSTIRFGVAVAAGDAVVSRILKRCMEVEPEARFCAEYAGSGELLKRLEQEKISFALVDGCFQREGCEFRHYSTEEYLAVRSPDYPLKEGPLLLEDLLEERLLFSRTVPGMWEPLERALHDRSFSIEAFAKRAEIDSLQAIKTLTKKGLGITFSYKIAVLEELKRGELIPIELEDVQNSQEFMLVWKKGKTEGKELFQELDSLTDAGEQGTSERRKDNEM